MPLLVFALHERISQEEVEGFLVLVALHRVMISVLELLLIEIECGGKLFELGVFYYLEVLLLFFGVSILQATVLGLVGAIFAHLNVSFLL